MGKAESGTPQSYLQRAVSLESWYLSNLSCLLCYKDNTFVFLSTYNWFSGNMTVAGDEESNILCDGERSCCHIT